MPAGAPSTPPEPARAPSSRDRILMAAKQLFASRGYENTSTVAIARLAGTSESQLMKHFGSKEGLLEAIFDAAWAQLSTRFAALQSIKSPREELNLLLETFLNALETDPATKELMLLEGRRVRKEGNLVVLTRGYLQFVQLVDTILTELKIGGELN